MVTSQNDGLQKRLLPRHITMMAMGGAIGKPSAKCYCMPANDWHSDYDIYREVS